MRLETQINVTRPVYVADPHTAPTRSIIINTVAELNQRGWRRGFYVAQKGGEFVRLEYWQGGTLTMLIDGQFIAHQPKDYRLDRRARHTKPHKQDDWKTLSIE